MSTWRKFFTDEEWEVMQRLASQMAAIANAEPAERCKVSDLATFEHVLRTALMCGFSITECNVDIATDDPDE